MSSDLVKVSVPCRRIRSGRTCPNCAGKMQIVIGAQFRSNDFSAPISSQDLSKLAVFSCPSCQVAEIAPKKQLSRLQELLAKCCSKRSSYEIDVLRDASQIREGKLRVSRSCQSCGKVSAAHCYIPMLEVRPYDEMLEASVMSGKKTVGE